MPNTVPPTKNILAITRDGKSIRKEVPKPIAVIDTREKLPYFDELPFKNWLKDTQKKCLKTGDYSVAGYEERISLERKTLADLVGTICQKDNRSRFVKEMERLSLFEKGCICIEASREDVKKPYTFTDNLKAAPNSVTGTLDAIAAKYPNIQIAYMSNRKLAEEFTASWLSKSATYLWLNDHNMGNCLISEDF